MSSSPALGRLRVRRWDYTTSPFSSRVRIPTSVTGSTIWRGIDYLRVSGSTGGESYGSFPGPHGINAWTYWNGVQYLIGGTPDHYEDIKGVPTLVGKSSGLASPVDSGALLTRGPDPWSESMLFPVWNKDIVALHLSRRDEPVHKGNDEVVFSIYTKGVTYPHPFLYPPVARARWVDVSKWRVPFSDGHICGLNGGTYHMMFWFRIDITGSYSGYCDGSMSTDNQDKCGYYFTGAHSSGNGHVYSGVPPMPVFATLQPSITMPDGFPTDTPW